VEPTSAPGQSRDFAEKEKTMSVGATPTVGQAADPHVFLVGRPPIGEYLGFVTAHTVGGDQQDLAELANAWRRANDHVLQLQATEAGFADDVPLTPLDPAVEALGGSVLSDAVVQRTFALVPIELGTVELDRLVVWQKKIDLAHVDRLTAALGEHPTAEDLFQLCLPIGRSLDPPVQAAQLADNAWGVLSTSNDLRLLRPRLLEPSAFTPDVAFDGVPMKVLAIPVGYGVNVLSAIRCAGRLVLNNGSHRAYALRAAGITHAPCLVQNVTRRDELEVIASGDFATHPERYLETPRPPVLRDYFDDQLRMIAPVARTARQVKVMFGREDVDVPRP
jgi:hypothetical protein